MTDSVKTLLEDYKELVSLPEVALRFNEVVNDPDCNIENIGQLLSQDPALTIRLLGIANSPFYGYSSEIGTVTRAVTVLGIDKVRDIVLSAAVTKAFDGVSVDVVSLDDFWYHSIYCGVLAKNLAPKTSMSPDAAFTAGLLHDIGELILLNRYPDEMHEVILRTVEGEQPLTMLEAELERLGTTHVEVGSELASSWRLPLYLQAVITWHHEPEKAGDFKQEVALIHIANAAAQFFGSDEDNITEKMDVYPESWRLSGLNPDDIAPAIEAADEQIEAVRQIYFPK